MRSSLHQTAHETFVAVAAMNAAILAKAWEGNVVLLKTGSQDSPLLVHVRSDEGNYLQVLTPSCSGEQSKGSNALIRIEAMIDGSTVSVGVNSLQDLRHKFHHLIYHQNYSAGTYVNGGDWAPVRNGMEEWASSFFGDDDNADISHFQSAPREDVCSSSPNRV